MDNMVSSYAFNFNLRRYMGGDEDEPNDYDRQDNDEALHTPHPLTPLRLTPSPAAATAAAADSKVNAGPRPDMTLARRFGAECAGLVPGRGFHGSTSHLNLSRFGP
jgi:hypothetical protein